MMNDKFFHRWLSFPSNLHITDFQAVTSGNFVLKELDEAGRKDLLIQPGSHEADQCSWSSFYPVAKKKVAECIHQRVVLNGYMTVHT